MVKATGDVLSIDAINWLGHVKNFRFPGVLPSWFGPKQALVPNPEYHLVNIINKWQTLSKTDSKVQDSITYHLTTLEKYKIFSLIILLDCLDSMQNYDIFHVIGLFCSLESIIIVEQWAAKNFTSEFLTIKVMPTSTTQSNPSQAYTQVPPSKTRRNTSEIQSDINSLQPPPSKPNAVLVP